MSYRSEYEWQEAYRAIEADLAAAQRTIAEQAARIGEATALIEKIHAAEVNSWSSTLAELAEDDCRAFLASGSSTVPAAPSSVATEPRGKAVTREDFHCSTCGGKCGPCEEGDEEYEASTPASTVTPGPGVYDVVAVQGWRNDPAPASAQGTGELGASPARRCPSAGCGLTIEQHLEAGHTPQNHAHLVMALRRPAPTSNAAFSADPHSPEVREFEQVMGMSPKPAPAERHAFVMEIEGRKWIGQPATNWTERAQLRADLAAAQRRLGEAVELLDSSPHWLCNKAYVGGTLTGCGVCWTCRRRTFLDSLAPSTSPPSPGMGGKVPGGQTGEIECCAHGTREGRCRLSRPLHDDKSTMIWPHDFAPAAPEPAPAKERCHANDGGEPFDRSLCMLDEASEGRCPPGRCLLAEGPGFAPASAQGTGEHDSGAPPASIRPGSEPVKRGAPTYNHTRGDSERTPCPRCVRLAFSADPAALMAMAFERLNDIEEAAREDGRAWGETAEALGKRVTALAEKFEGLWDACRMNGIRGLDGWRPFPKAAPPQPAPVERHACRRCSECEGQEHHWIESYEEDSDAMHACKHCEIEGDECELCDGDGERYVGDTNAGLCPKCGGYGVIARGGQPRSAAVHGAEGK